MMSDLSGTDTVVASEGTSPTPTLKDIFPEKTEETLTAILELGKHMVQIHHKIDDVTKVTCITQIDTALAKVQAGQADVQTFSRALQDSCDLLGYDPMLTSVNRLYQMKLSGAEHGTEQEE